MAHVRKTARAALAAQVAGLATTGSSVFASRVYTVAPDALPCLLIYAREEASEIVTQGLPRALLRTTRFAVEAIAAANAALDDTLDQICTEVEVALGTDPTLGGTVRDLVLTETQVSLKGEGEQVYGSARMTFEAVTVTAENDPTTLR